MICVEVLSSKIIYSSILLHFKYHWGCPLVQVAPSQCCRDLVVSYPMPYTTMTIDNVSNDQDRDMEEEELIRMDVNWYRNEPPLQCTILEKDVTSQSVYHNWRHCYQSFQYHPYHHALKQWVESLVRELATTFTETIR